MTFSLQALCYHYKTHNNKTTIRHVSEQTVSTKCQNLIKHSFYKLIGTTTWCITRQEGMIYHLLTIMKNTHPYTKWSLFMIPINVSTKIKLMIFWYYRDTLHIGTNGIILYILSYYNITLLYIRLGKICFDETVFLEVRGVRGEGATHSSFGTEFTAIHF